MAVRDITFYKYIEAAFRHKLYKDTTAPFFNYLGYNLPYVSKGATKGIFEYARRVLPFAYTNAFPDTEEGNLQMAKAVIDKLDLEDKPLEVYVDPAAVPKDYDLISADARTQSEQALPVQTGGQSAGTMAGGMGLPSLPSLPSIHNIPRAPNLPDKLERDTSSTISTFKNFGANVGSSGQIGIKRFTNRLGSGISNFFKGTTRAGVNLLGGSIGVGGRFLGRAGMGGVNAFGRLSNEVTRRGSLVKGSSTKRIALLFIGIFFVSALLLGVIGAGPGGTNPPGQPSGGGSGSITSCQFTRSGASQPIKSSTLQSWILASANSQGIPASILASIAMHENQTLLSKDDNDPAIKSNQFCNDGPPVCVDMKTNTINPPGHAGACSPDEEATGTLKTARARGLMQLLDIYYPGFPFCDIQANIQRAAETLKGKLGSGSWSNENDVRKAVCGFFGLPGETSCHYTPTSPYDYAQEVWTDLQNCKQTTTTPPSNSICSQPSTRKPILEGPTVIGSNANGTPINSYKLGTGATKIAIVGGMNGRQEQSGIDIVNAAIQAFSADTSYTVPSDVTLYFVPEITPDSTDGFNVRGQDINRNFSSNSVPGGQWNSIGCSINRYKSAAGNYLTSCQDDNTRALFTTYCQSMAPGAPDSINQFTCAPNKTGSAAFSEPETQAIKNFLQGSGIRTVISYRAPINNVTSSNAPPGRKLAGVDNLAQLFARDLGINYDQYFTSYPVPGQLMDWLQDVGIVSVEIELPSTSLSDSVKTKNLSAIQDAVNSLSKAKQTSGGICQVVYYCQGNTSWQQCSLGRAGCGPASLAMIISSFGIIMTPPQVDEIFQSNNWRSCGDNPSYLVSAITSSWFSSLGFEVGPNLIIEASAFDIQQAKTYLDKGYLIIGSSSDYPCANCRSVGALIDHIFVVDGVDTAANTADIRDPNNCSYADGNDENQSNRIKSVVSFHWKYAYPIKKVR